MTTSIFTNEQHLQLNAECQFFSIDKGEITKLGLCTGLWAVCFLFIAFLEYELGFRAFDNLSMGEGYWSPHLMAFSSLVMIIGFHFLAEHRPNNFAVRMVNTLVEFLIPLYVIGLGLFVAAPLMLDMQGAFDVGSVPVIGGLPEVEQGLLHSLMMNIASPVAMLFFSLGIGGLAIVNLFVAHRLILMIVANVNKMNGKLSLARKAKFLLSEINRLEKEYQVLQHDMADLELHDERYLKLIIAAEALSTMASALVRHKEELKAQEYAAPPGAFDDFIGKKTLVVDVKKLKADIGRIEAITQDDILQAMNINSLRAAL